MLGLLSHFAALVAATNAVAPPPPAIDQGMEGAEILDLERERYERLTVPVKIGGAGPFNFMIDTGAQATVLSHELANQLALTERATAVLVGMVSRRPIETVAVDGLELGSRSFNIARAPLVPRANIGSADGILGIDSLQDQRVLLDFSKEEISVASAKELGGNSGYEIIVSARRQLGQLIITEARLDGIRVSVLVDTGAQGSVGNLALLERLKVKEHDTTQLTDINGVQLNGSLRYARALDIGSARLEKFPVVFTDSPTFAALGLRDKPALMLGMNELRLFRRVAIDFKTRRILFDLPRSVGFARPYYD